MKNRQGLSTRVLLLAGLAQMTWAGAELRLAAAGPGPSTGNPENRVTFLSVGSRVKVEGSAFDGSTLMASKIEVVEDDDEVEIEGILVKVDRQLSLLQISSQVVLVTDSTRIVDTARDRLALQNLSPGMRVKIKAEMDDDRSLVAQTVRYYPGATDTDLEIEAPIEKIDRKSAVLTILAMQIQVSPDTEYFDPSGGSHLKQFFPESRGIRRDDDEPDRPPLRLWKLDVGGRAGVAYRATDNLDLLDRRRDEAESWAPQSRLEFSLPVGEHSEVYSKLTFSNPIDTSQRPAQGDFQFEVRELFFNWGRFLHRSVSLQIGRQRFRDRREWTYDDELDAIRLHLKTRKIRWEFAAAKSVFRPTNARQDQLHFLGQVEIPLARKRRLRGYVIKRNDLTPRDEDPVWFGASTRGSIGAAASYWGEVSRMMGRHRQDRLRGYAWDAGGSYRFRLPWRPTLSASYAFASGGDDRAGRVDHNFRQTQLQDNTDRLGGIRRYNYYGLLIDAELSNLKIPSLDLGIRPSRILSVNLVYHSYRQTVPSRDVGDMNLTRPPNGRDSRLGREADAVIALRLRRRVDVSLLVGVFFPGAAFGQSVSPAWLVRPSLLFHF